MTAIDERHVQWATIDRMRQMLVSPRRDFEITQTYTLFTGILCWVMQRVRWDHDDTPLKDSMRALKADLEAMFFVDFLRPLARTYLQDVTRPDAPSDHSRFNDFSGILKGDRSGMSALDGLVHLRNAVAHGDHRRVTPVNKDMSLVGYRIECEKLPSKKDPSAWKAKVCLDRKGMAFIAESLADKFCKAALPEPDVREAQKIRESKR